MKRHFYTDPLAAAWQAKHFGMRFIRRTTSDEGTYDEVGIEMEMRHFFAHANYVSNADLSHVYLVHPESLYLLEPRKDDLVAFRDGHAAKVGFLAKRHPDSFTVYGGLMCFETDPNLISSIVQRNGKAFMWPESEDA